MSWWRRLSALRLVYRILRENKVPKWLTPPHGARYLEPQRDNVTPWVIATVVDAEAATLIERVIRELPVEDDGSYSLLAWMVRDSDGRIAVHTGTTLLGHTSDHDGARFASAYLSGSQPVWVEGRLQPWEWHDDQPIVDLLVPSPD